MMTQYRVTGTVKIATKPGRMAIFGLNTIDRTVLAESIPEAQSKALIGSGGNRWHTGPDVIRIGSLRDIEQQALADWNAGRPTASPLALAQARGEL